MIKQPILMRDRTAKLVDNALHGIFLYAAWLPDRETDVLNAIGTQQQRFDMTVELTLYILAKFGHVEAVKEPRFSKTRRRLSKQRLKPPRGIPKSALEAIA